ncbi:VOC family protein [Dethiosulfatarculus sandiegensis]|uniref:VOC domain-containing protein n=1 Tax=Dethiosulfatarculus sandiegensis TaxID=1429043 RepID=A0A0D2HWA9_9BACT|nr:VOC family protein [Dethiosulfatarculus sandiegensis]KIX14658.1 hypothetical protein X474_08280 [Dethiosulfatarculus sandiegensis]
MRFDHLHLLCRDLEKSVSWYRDVLGAKVTLRSEATGRKIVRMDLAGMKLALSPWSGPEQGADRVAGPGAYQIGFMVDDLENTLRDLQGKKVKPTRGPLQIKPGLLAAFIQDPDGVEVELMQETG